MDAIARKPYPTDRTDARWEVMRIVIPDANLGGRPRSVSGREVVNAPLDRSGCPWDMRPHDLPPKSTASESVAAWRDGGPWQARLDVPREAYRESHARSGEPTPSAGSIDRRTVEGAEVGGDRGHDGGKELRGRRRRIGADAVGLLLAVAVTGAGVDDAKAAPQVREQLDARRGPRLEAARADATYRNHDRNAWAAKRAELRWRSEVVRRPAEAKGFVLRPKRWVAERTFARMGGDRRPSRDDERLATSGERVTRIRGLQVLLERMAPSGRNAPFGYRVANA